MKDDWLNNIRDKMSEYETDAPPELWQQVESDIARHSRRRQVWLWTARAVAAAAVIVVALVIGLGDGTDDTLTVGGQTARNRTSTPTEKDTPTSTEKTVTVDEIRTASSAAPRYAYASTSVAKASERHEVASAPVTEGNTDRSDNTAETAIDTTAVTDTPRLPSVEERDNRTHGGYGTTAATPKQTPDGATSRMSMSMYTTAGTGGTTSQRYSSFGVMSPAMDNAVWAGSPVTGVLVSNHGRLNDRKVNHHLPVHAGANVAYRINDRWAIETGLSYTYLSTDIRDGSETYYYSGEQKLHFLGIPVGARFRAFSWKALDVYVGAGAMAEMCVSGKLDKTYILSGRTVDSEHEDARMRPLQWSANATAGLQYNITPLLGVYVEPGVNYYFDNGSDIETIYSDKPFNFNLNVGLRLTFGNKR